MGCTSSKLDDLPAVALCRDRCSFLDDAIRHRFSFAQAHLSYTHSLLQIANSLHHFMDQHHSSYAGGPTPLSPNLNLPPNRKGLSNDHELSSSPPLKVHAPDRYHSHSSSGSHLHFHSDDDSDRDDDDDGSVSHLHHSGHSSPLHPHIDTSGAGGGRAEYMSSAGYMGMGMGMGMGTDHDSYPGSGGGGGGGGGGGFLHMNYMKNKATPPSVVYEQKPVPPETVYFGDSSSSSYYYPNTPYPPNNPYPPSSSSSNPYFGYQNYGYGGAGGGAPAAGYYGAQPTYGSQQAAASSSKPPPPPPSPPRASAWDFLNPFESYEKFYPQYTPSRNSKDLREEEGIPDLEDEDYHEVVKEVHGDQRYGGSKAVMTEDEDDGDGGGASSSGGAAEASLYQTRPSISTDNAQVEFEVRVVDKKVVDSNERSEERSSNARGGGGGPRDAAQVAVEIKILFEKASECGGEIAKLLEVGRHPHYRKHVSKMLQGVTAPLSMVASSSGEASSSTDKAGPPFLDIDEELAMRSKNLSSTLHKLHLWEKKLYNEVKVEEKMRVVHERKCRKLKRMDERGAEAQKVDAARIFIRSLSTKIRMAIQVVDKISVTINKIRDEELWPQLNELIQGLTRMWKSMLECHHTQCQAIKEARGFGPIGSGKKLSDDHLNATLQLEHELLSWISSFSSWIGAQKGFVRALNSWLVKCLLYEPEETPDGIVPFSPGRLGAPPVFVICNQWAQAMERVSEKEVIDAMRVFAMSVLQLWEQDKQEMRQRMVANKELERKVRNLEREDQKIQKEIHALDKKIVLVAGEGNGLSVTGNIVYQSDTTNASLQGSLQRIFEAMENFMAESMKAYVELMQRSDELRRQGQEGNISDASDDDLDDDIIELKLEDETKDIESLSTSELNGYDGSAEPSERPAASSLPLKKQGKHGASKKKINAKVKGGKAAKLDVPGSAKRLRVKEKALLTDVFTKYGSKIPLASGKES